MLKDRAYAIRKPCSTTPTTSAMWWARPWCARPRAASIDCEANYAVFRTKLSKLSTVFNVGRYIDAVVSTEAGLKFQSAGASTTAR
jgi:salicylate 5-hydroxylase small subunit